MERGELGRGSVGGHRGRNTVGRENQGGPRGKSLDGEDKERGQLREGLNEGVVVEELLGEGDGSRVKIEGLFQGDDGTINSRAVAPGRSQEDFALSVGRRHASIVGPRGDDRLIARQAAFAHSTTSTSYPHAMALETGPDSPVPVRTVSQMLSDWIGKLGAI